MLFKKKARIMTVVVITNIFFFSENTIIIKAFKILMTACIIFSSEHLQSFDKSHEKSNWNKELVKDDLPI